MDMSNGFLEDRRGEAIPWQPQAAVEKLHTCNL